MDVVKLFLVGHKVVIPRLNGFESVADTVQIAGLFGSRMGFSQRFGRGLRPKGGSAYFYELATEGTEEQEYSERRREYLVSKGHDFDIIDMTGEWDE